MRLRIVITYLIGITTFFSCNHKSFDLNNNVEEIISITIDSLSFPLPPLPEIVNDSLVSGSISEKTKDSLKEVRMKVAIYPLISLGSSEDFLKLKGNKLSLNKTLENSINKISKHNVVIADTLVLKKTIDWKEYDLLYRFSKVNFNSDSTCITSVGLSRSGLWGQGYDIYYEKKGGNWKIIKLYKTEKW
ncbi:hypothetical protein EVU94_03330 [Flavobacteriaceae bacterium 144Ye]|nr:hypothetical protein EVU94_03330 [Flavobacteriaceae bacterium 144Ye]